MPISLQKVIEILDRKENTMKSLENTGLYFYDHKVEKCFDYFFLAKVYMMQDTKIQTIK